VMYSGPIGGRLTLLTEEVSSDDGFEYHAALWRLLGRYHLAAVAAGYELIIICERFQFRPDDAQSREKIELISKEYEGVVKLYAEYNDVKLVSQNSAQAVGATAFWGDANGANKGNHKIKKLGLWKVDNPHAMDALRHYLYYVTFTLKDNFYLHQMEARPQVHA
jgi:hypothetical protein